MLEDNPAKTFLEDEAVFEHCFNTFIRDWCLYAGLDIADASAQGILDDEFFKELKAVKVSRKKWRKSLWKKIQVTAMTDPWGRKAKELSPHAHLGYFLGNAVSSLVCLTESMNDEEIRRQFGTTEDEGKELIELAQELNTMSRKNVLHQSDICNEYFYKGKRRYSDGGYAMHATSATVRHYVMLMLGPRLEEMRSVDMMYDFLVDLMGEKMDMTRQSFKDFCKTIGLQGKRYKRLRSNQVRVSKAGHPL